MVKEDTLPRIVSINGPCVKFGINVAYFFIISVALRARGRRAGLMVSVLDSRSGGPGSSPCRVHFVVFLGKTLYSHSASLHSGV